MALPLVVSAGLSISPPFNAVWVVVLGLFSVRSRRFACFLALCAFAVCLLITSQQGKIYLQSVGGSAPIANVSEPGGIRRYLQFCLARWMSTVLFSAFVLKAVYRVLPFPRVGCYIRVAFLALLLYIIRAGGDETSTLNSVSTDWGVRFYLQSSLLLESARAAVQVTFIMSGAIVRDVNVRKPHVFLYSALILIHNLLSVYFTGLNPYTLDNILQVILILYLHLCPVPNGRIHREGAVEAAQQIRPLAHGQPQVPDLQQLPILYVSHQAPAFHGLPEAPIFHGLLQPHEAQGHDNRPPSPTDDNHLHFLPSVPETRQHGHSECLVGIFDRIPSATDHTYLLPTSFELYQVPTDYKSPPQLVWPEDEAMLGDGVVPFQDGLSSKLHSDYDRYSSFDVHPVTDKLDNIEQLFQPTPH